MAFEVIWHPSASIDFEEVIGYVFHKFGKTAAKKLYEEVMERMETVSRFPNIGVKYEGRTYHNNEVRVMNIRQNALVYAVDKYEITIIVFWSNRQNPKCLPKLVGSR